MNGLGRGDAKQEKNLKVVTRETVGMTLLLFSIIIFFIAVTGRLVFGDIGVAITAFFVGLSGFFVYPLLVLSIYYSLVLVTGKKLLPAGWIVKGLLVTLAVFFIVHTATAERFFGNGYGEYLSGCWNAAKEGTSGGTGGGVLLGLIAYPVRFLLSAPGAYIIFSLLLILSLFYAFTATALWKRLRNAPRKAKTTENESDGESRAYPPAVSFEELEAERASADVRTAPPQDPYAYGRQPQTGYDAQTGVPAPQPDSRDILYRGDPASRYTENLFFDRNSRFNTTARQSSLQYGSDGTPLPYRAPSASSARPVQSAPAPVQPSVAQPAPRERYSSSYASEAETTRPPMPKRVTDTTDGYYSHDASFDYPKAPTYRAPDLSGTKKPFSEPLQTPADPPKYEEPPKYEPPKEEPVPPSRGETIRDFAPKAQESAPVTPPDDPRELPPVRERTEPPARVDFSRRPPEQDGDAVVPKRRTSLHDYLSSASEETKKSTPPLPRSQEQGEPPVIRELPQEPIRREEPPVRYADRFRTEEENVENEGGMSSEENVFDAPAAPTPRRSVAQLFDEPEIPAEEETEEDMPPERARPALTRVRPLAPAPTEPAPAPMPIVREKYVEPSLEDLAVYDETISVNDEEVEKNVTIILDTLKGFNVEAMYLNCKRGPTVTQYNIDVPRNVPVSTVVRREAEIAMRLHAKNGVNIYSNPQAEAISIEVPNAKRSIVSMRTVMQGEEYVNAKPNSLVFTMGLSVEGKPVCGDVVDMTHILVAGGTGSGKSVMLNAMLISLLYKYSPEELRLILIDPKKIEFGIYDGIPHLMIKEVIADEKKAVTALAWAVGEMDRRYLLFEKKVKDMDINVRTIDEYNAHLVDGEQKLPKIVIVIDELADLMATVAKDIEVYIQRIAQKARAAGKHLVLATQRPSADIITGIIKANLPTRIAFSVAQEVNSRIILDETGAEKLLGKGDMLFKTNKMQSCQRLQGVLIDSPEVEAVIKDIKANNKSYYDQSVDDYINSNRSSGGGAGDDEEKEVNEEYIRALRICVQLKQASISLIQRKCSVGYNHAGKIIEWMEAKGYITPFDGKAKARTMLLTQEEFDELYGGD